MTFSKIVDGEYISAVMKSNGGTGNITEEEYNAIRAAISQVPERREGYRLRLHDNSLEWEYIAIPAPEEDEISDAEALEIITGGESDEAE